MLILRRKNLYGHSCCCLSLSCYYRRQIVQSHLSFKIIKELRVCHLSSSALLSKWVIYASRPDLWARFYGHLDFIR